MSATHHLEIGPSDCKRRLDDFLYDAFPNLSRMYLRETVRDGKCEVNGRLENRGYLLRERDFIEIRIDAGRRTESRPEAIPLDLHFEDESIIVLEKPAGMLVHPTVGVRDGTVLNALAHHLNPLGDGPRFNRAGLVHRLDKDTSGLMVVAKTRQAHRVLSSHFQRKLVEKRYFAVVEGPVGAESGTLEAPIGRCAETRTWGVKQDGKQSETRFSVLRRGPAEALLELEPVTGRTNQLRIHLSHFGNPIVGDRRYGGRTFARLCLHASLLRFRHPADGRTLEFATGVPPDFAGV